MPLPANSCSTNAMPNALSGSAKTSTLTRPTPGAMLTPCKVSPKNGHASPLPKTKRPSNLRPSPYDYGSSANPPVAAAPAGADSRSAAGSLPTPAAWPAVPHRRAATSDSGSNFGRCRSLNTPDADSPRSSDRDGPPLHASRRALEFFCCEILQHGVVQHRNRPARAALRVLGIGS